MVAGTGEGGRQQALAALRKAIVDGDMAPGQRLVESELAEMLPEQACTPR